MESKIDTQRKGKSIVADQIDCSSEPPEQLVLYTHGNGDEHLLFAHAS